jgi:hypothetical protein
MSPYTLKNYRWLRKRWDEKASSALAMARANTTLRGNGCTVERQEEQERPEDVFGKACTCPRGRDCHCGGCQYDPEAQHYRILWCAPDGHVLDALGMVGGDSDYLRYVEFQTAREALGQFDDWLLTQLAA